MKKIHLILNLNNLWVEFALGAVMVVAFAALGYFAREFALDLQANFFSTDWGSF
ncbi:hypothetical protein K9M41_02715 [Candidatus Gracilibacteria bacterium]|nr:hypothetical protein [Candidatus Gracilibacteria bacterium]